MHCFTNNPIGLFSCRIDMEADALFSCISFFNNREIVFEGEKGYKLLS
jgi:hypothetical protein